MTLDELLLEWSYRSERGYPTLDNPSDILLLENILKEKSLPFEEIQSTLHNLNQLMQVCVLTMNVFPVHTLDLPS